jgi:hypothetical protein
VVRTNPFGDNRAGERAYRRAERIVAALFLLTNHIPHTEPLRATIRSEAVALLERILGVRDEMRSPQSTAVLQVRASLRKLISLVQILGVSGAVSAENADTIIRALDELGNFFVVSQKSVLSESVVFSQEEFLDVHAALPRSTAPRRQKDIKDTHEGRGGVGIERGVDVSDVSQKGGDTSVRKQSIVEIVRAGGTLGIKEIASNLPEYSEKMIQRELLDLVSSGRVKKTGDKRWSRYSIA